MRINFKNMNKQNVNVKILEYPNTVKQNICPETISEFNNTFKEAVIENTPKIELCYYTLSCHHSSFN